MVAAALEWEGRRTVAVARSEGSRREHCGACGRSATEYRRKPSGVALTGLVWLVSKGGDWEHVDVIRVRGTKRTASALGGGWQRLQDWGLIEPKPRDPEDTGKTHSGMWRATELGRAFALGLETIPSHRRYLFGQHRVCPDAGDVLIGAALGNRFDYTEILPASRAADVIMAPYRRDWRLTVRRSAREWVVSARHRTEDAPRHQASGGSRLEAVRKLGRLLRSAGASTGAAG